MRLMLVLMMSFLLTFQVYAADDGTLVIYSGRSESLVGPILEKFSKETGIPIDVRYGTTGILTAQVLTERHNTPADVLFFQDSGYLGILANEDMLDPLPQNVLEQVASQFQDPEGYWLGTSARMRVLTYNTAKFSQNDNLNLPETLEELADMDVVKAWSPVNAGFQAHVTALRDTLWGEDKTEAWLNAIENNEHGQVTSFDGNAAMVAAVARGEVDIAWTNHYYLYNVVAGNAALADQVANYSFPEAGNAGNILITAGVGIVKDSMHQEAARKLIEFLVSEDVQALFTEDTFEYPTRPNVAVNVALPSLDNISFAKVDQIIFTDLRPTLDLLRRLQIL